MQHLTTAAMHQHHRIRMTHLRRNQILHVHLPRLDGPVRHLLPLHAHPEEAHIGKLHSRFTRVRRANRRILLHRLRYPFENRLQHFAVVLLHHHEVRVAVNAALREADMFHSAAGLAEERHAAPVVGDMIRRFGSHNRNRNVLQVDQLARGLFLDQARLLARIRRRDLLRLESPTGPAPEDRK